MEDGGEERKNSNKKERKIEEKLKRNSERRSDWRYWNWEKIKMGSREGNGRRKDCEGDERLWGIKKCRNKRSIKIEEINEWKGEDFNRLYRRYIRKC